MATLTHYTDSDYPSRLVRAICGRTVRPGLGEVDLQHPTCPRCAALLAEREAEPLPAWAQEGLRR